MQDVILKIRLEQYYFLKRNKLKTEKSADADQKEKKKKKKEQKQQGQLWFTINCGDANNTELW